MIGNDIIDLRLTKFKNAARFERYAQKICRPQELNEFGVYESKELSLWRFWSLKEAAYKAAVRLGYSRRFSPQSTRVFLKSTTQAEVRLDHYLFSAKTNCSSQFVYSEVFEVDQQDTVTRTIIDREVDGVLPNKVLKKGRLPFYMGPEGSLYPASITHHGRFYSLMHTV